MFDTLLLSTPVEFLPSVGIVAMIGVFGYLCYLAANDELRENREDEPRYYIDYEGDIIFL